MNREEYRKKVMGCWLGKAVGGTLGQPYEGHKGPLNLTYYEPVPADMIPNDDLDLQVLWAYALNEMQLPVVDRDVLADAWLKHVAFPWDEYGIAIRNLRNGIRPPLSGSYDNWFKDGLGAAIRSEIWACLAPGDPEMAVKFAYEDACVDHVGDGIYAEQFLAALESEAFVESDIDKLLDAGLKFLPVDSRLAQAIVDTRKWCRLSGNYLTIREQILEKYGCGNFTDVVMNIPIVVMALLLSKGDFSKAICMAVNCGCDADCTTASVGAVMGIISPDCIEGKWLKPIGRKLVINDGIVGISHPETLDEFTDMIADLRERVKLRSSAEVPGCEILDKHKLQAETGIYSAGFPSDTTSVREFLSKTIRELHEFPGNYGSILAELIPSGWAYMIRLLFELDEKQKVRIMFNSASSNKVWLDGGFAFGRENGNMIPSFHRVPANQFADIELGAGMHELLAMVSPSAGEKCIEWVVGVGDVETKQWLPDVFRKIQ
jgi:ADP-ribosylglycohydrolase